MQTSTDLNNSKNEKELDANLTFLRNKHLEFILGLENKKDEYEYQMTEHLRMSAIYQAISAMYMMNALDEMNRDSILEFVFKCQNSDGGFGGNIDHDSHILYTLSAIQILAIYGLLPSSTSTITLNMNEKNKDDLKNKILTIDLDSVAKYILSLQQSDGSFSGDIQGEVDTRFSYCALCCLAIIGKLDLIDCKKTAEFVCRCQNFDGAFGCRPGAESHGGQVFCCVASLAICNSLDKIDANLLGWQCCERQLECGGLNGRPEKKEDVCYSQQVLSALSIIKRQSQIDRGKLIDFILTCQDDDNGGFSDRPQNISDVYHTYFGIAGLSLLEYFKKDSDNKYILHQEIDPVYALPSQIVTRLFPDKYN